MRQSKDTIISRKKPKKLALGTYGRLLWRRSWHRVLLLTFFLERPWHLKYNGRHSSVWIFGLGLRLFSVLVNVSFRNYLTRILSFSWTGKNSQSSFFFLLIEDYSFGVAGISITIYVTIVLFKCFARLCWWSITMGKLPFRPKVNIV